MKRGRTIRPESLEAAGVLDVDVLPGALGFLPREIDFLAVVLAGQDEADDGEETDASKEVTHREENR